MKRKDYLPKSPSNRKASTPEYMARFAMPVAAARKSRPVSDDDSGSDTSYSSEDSYNNGHPTTATPYNQSHSNSVRSECRTEMLPWTLQLKAAERRTPTGVTSLYRDKWTAVAKSTVAGRGLFAMRKIPAGFVLYVYTGVKRTSQDADRYPNAYQLDLNDGSVCDAGDASHSSPARWVNTRDGDLQLARLLDQVSESAQNNCEYEEYSGTLYLVTTRSIKPFQELFASYDREDEGFPEWPQVFLGDGRVLVTKYKEYLMSPPEDADSDEEDQAKQLQAWLQTDLDEAQDKIGHAHMHPSLPGTHAAKLSH